MAGVLHAPVVVYAKYTRFDMHPRYRKGPTSSTDYIYAFRHLITFLQI